MSPAQQQQMAQAMGYFTQGQQQLGGPPGPPPGQSPVRPPEAPPGMPPGMVPQFRPPPGVNPAEFPFDVRLLPILAQMSNPQWREQMQARNPQLVQEIVSITQRIQTGQIRPEMLQKMQQFLMAMQRFQASRGGPQPGQPQPPMPPPGQQQHPMAGAPSFPQHPGIMQGPPPGGPPTGPHPGAMPPGAQQRMWPQQPGAGSPATPATPTARPPPAHLPPGSGGPLESPSGNSAPIHARRATKQEKQQRESTMPPPTFIPTHGTPGRPPAAEQQPAPTPPPPPPGGLPVREWEGALRLDLPTTNIQPLPTDDVDERADPTFAGKLPELQFREKEDLKVYIQRDKDFAAHIPEHRKKMAAKMARWSENEDRQTPWWMLRKGDAPPPKAPRGGIPILYPADKAAQRVKARKRREIRL